MKSFIISLLVLTMLIPGLSHAAQPLPPAETGPANTAYRPAFEGQTRAPGAKTLAPYEVSVLSRDLQSPWGIAALPDGRFLITQKGGSLRIASMKGELGEAVGGFAPVDDSGQGGLLDVAPAPEFDISRMVYFTLSEKAPQGSLTALGRGRLSPDEKRIEGFEIIYRALPYFGGSAHYGSRIAFEGPGSLFLSTGDRQSLKTRPLAQLMDNGLGKIIRVTGLEGAAPQGEVYSLGHRNVQGLAFDEKGNLWAGEMGPRGGDELNLIRQGVNYGWPVITYGIEYSGEKIGEGITQKEGMAQPVYYWDPVLAPDGMTFYRGSAMPEWQGSLFIGGLGSRHISRLVMEDNRVIAEERLLAQEGQRFRDIAQGADGALYAVTDEGRLYRIGKPAL